MDEAPKNNFAEDARAWAIALNVVYGLIGFGLMGFAIDHFAGTGPTWMLILGGVGLFVGLYRFIREALSLNKRAADRSRAGQDGENRR